MARKLQEKHLVDTPTIDITDSMETMLDEGVNKYLLINLIARRGRELNRGARALAMPESEYKPSVTEIAMAEAEAGKLEVIHKQKSRKLVSLIKND